MRVRILLLGDHSAMLIGIRAMVASVPDLELVAAASTERELWPLLRQMQPDVVLLDLHHPRRDVLSISLRIRRRRDAPGVVLYSAAADDATVVAAALAGVGAVVRTSSPTETLLDAIRAVARSPRALPRVSLQMRREAAARLNPQDLSIFAMRLAGDAPAEIGHTLRLPARAVRGRLAAMIAQLSSIESAHGGPRWSGDFAQPISGSTDDRSIHGWEIRWWLQGDPSRQPSPKT